MLNNQPNSDLLTKEQRAKISNTLRAYLKKEYDLNLGIIGADEILDLLIKEFGREIYNKAIGDAKTAYARNHENLEVDLDLLASK